MKIGYTLNMISKYTYKKLTWIDLESPTRDEMLSICEEYNLPELVGDELLIPNYRSKVDKYGDLMYLILHFPILSANAKKSTEQEIDFVIGHDFLITTHYETIDPLNSFSRLFSKDSIMDKRVIEHNGGMLFYFMAKELYRHTERELEDLNPILKKIEEGVFQGNEKAMVELISKTNKKLLDFKQALRFHHDLLSSFEKSSVHFFGDEFKYYASAIVGEYNKTVNLLEGHIDFLRELRSTNDSLLSTKMSNIMKNLTMASFIVFPLSLIAGIFGMNAQHMPIIGANNDFWVIVAIMLVATTYMFMWFRYKKWL
jgi:magnesium transporter